VTPPRHLARQVAAVAVFALACAAIFLKLFSLAGGRVQLGHRYTFQAIVPTAVALAPHADVRLAGVRVGQITTIAPRAGATALGVEIDRHGLRAHDDATVRVRTKTLVGENYLELDPGTRAAPLIPDGGVLPEDRAQESVQFDQILSILDAPTRGQLRVALHQLGAGMAGRGGGVNNLFEASSAVVTEGSPVAAVLGAQHQQVAGLIGNLATTIQALATRTTDLRLLVTSARQTAQATAAEQAGFRALLRAMPGTLQSAQQAAGHLGRFSGSATPVIENLAGALRELAPAIDELPTAASSTEHAVTQLTPFSSAGRALLAAARTVSPPGTVAVGQLDGLLRELHPILAYLAPYSRETAAFFTNFGSATSDYDATGALARVYAIASRSAYAGFTPQMRSAFDALSRAGAIGLTAQQGTNPYPAPGGMANPAPYSGRYPRIGRDR
jgi:phospholipid/cholesterol/gamma-HCH transport system substrate-binding protein